MSQSIPPYAFNRSLQTEDFLEDQTLLTRFSSPNKPIRSFEGRVGNAYPGDVIVTTPNMDYLYAPPINERRVRLRKDLHFGEDDPLLFPQPFNRNIAHLSVIQLPSTDKQNPHYAAWARPQITDFEERATLDICTGMGRLYRGFYWAFDTMASRVLERAESKKEDRYVTSQSTHLRQLMERLESQWATRMVTFQRFALAQRHYLELLARLDWIDKFRGRYMDGNVSGGGVSDGVPVDGRVVGAFADDQDVVDRLFHAGIPVWYTRPISQALDVRIDKVGDFIDKNPWLSIELHCGYTINLGEATPPHRVIYTGLANKPERYLAMAQYVQSLLQYPSLFGSSEPRSSTSLVRTSLSSSSSVVGSSSRSTPYQGGKGNPKQSDRHGINTFLDPDSRLMPSGITAWQDALAALSSYNNAQPPPNGIDNGFAVPPPRLFINAKDDSTKARLISNWLKLRDLFLFRLSVDPSTLTAKQWRSLLELRFDNHPSQSSQSSDGLSRSKKFLNEMNNRLKKFVDESQISLNLENLDSAKAVWRDRQISGDRLPSDSTVREVMWELFELNFRRELLVLDTRLDMSSMPALERKLLLDKCYTGSADNVIFPKNETRGLGSPSIRNRIPFLEGLHNVMSTWRIQKPIALLDAFPRNTEAHNYLETVRVVERAIASSYTIAFLDIFCRAASVPHQLS
ncbi:hypothetical protein E1B28_011923 [Marasmius oreades]|uniref:Uncharacterized protein n=1 Tax=Marasmius oreades TaxID=181124 RepID=A0A9P7RV96_9AGAR|nr:uncharacterized protein E1B28_011923 [Marasmius oreades]KAG7090327.1 hypothetical protein E1B28_011923 [Marasmius oreades]